MPASDSYGDSDDEALFIAATQAAESQARDDFEASPRATKRRRVEEPLEAQSTEEDYFDDDEMLHDGALGHGDEAREDNDPEAGKRKHLFHAPRIMANLDRVILTQTQAVPASQPWMIRGPIWKRPKIPEQRPNTISNFVTNGSERRPGQVVSHITRNGQENLLREITIGNINGVEKFSYVATIHFHNFAYLLLFPIRLLTGAAVLLSMIQLKTWQNYPQMPSRHLRLLPGTRMDSTLLDEWLRH
jgi:hypothetical protein